MNTAPAFLKNPRYKTEIYGAKQLSLFDSNSIKDAFSIVSSIPDYSVTRLIEMPISAEVFGVGSLYCKYEGDRFGGSSFKTLGLSNAVITAVRRLLTDTPELDIQVSDLIDGKFKDKTKSITLSAATSGNHGYALAWVSKLLGAKCKIYCAKGVSKNRTDRILDLGAEVIFVNGSFDEAVNHCSIQSRIFGDIVVSNVVQKGFEDIPKLIMNGYGIIAKEISEQLTTVVPTHIFVGGGGGRLAASLAAYYSVETRFGSPKIVVVEPVDSDCIFQSLTNGNLSRSSSDGNSIMTGLVVKQPSPIAWDILEHNTFASVVISDEIALEVLRVINVGIFGDPPIMIGETGIAAMAGFVSASRSSLMRAELEINMDSNIIVVACEGVIDKELLDSLLVESNSQWNSL